MVAVAVPEKQSGGKPVESSVGTILTGHGLRRGLPLKLGDIDSSVNFSNGAATKALK